MNFFTLLFIMYIIFFLDFNLYNYVYNKKNFFLELFTLFPIFINRVLIRLLFLNKGHIVERAILKCQLKKLKSLMIQ